MLSQATLDHGARVAAALLGVDALYRSESEDEDGLVVLDMSRGALPVARYANYAEAQAAWQMLDAAAEQLPEADRRMYYHQLAGSTLAFIEWRTHGLSLAEQLAGFLHVPSAPVSDVELNNLRKALGTHLTEMGFAGNLEEQCAAWQASVLVQPDAVEGVLQDLFDEAWDRTNRVIPIPADKADGMQVQAVRGVAFNARCNYLERKVELNVDPVLTRPALKHLALHECYPGHYVQFKLREVWYHAGKAPADGLLSVVNTASSSPFEGIADNGIFLLDWFEGDDDRVQHILSRYRSAIGTVAAWKLHALGASEADVRAWLAQASLGGGPGWVDNRMRFIAAPARAVLIWSYWWGQAVVTDAYMAAPAQRKADYLEFLYGRMHSPQTVAMFA